MNTGEPDGRGGGRIGAVSLAAVVVTAALTPWLGLGVGVVGAASCTPVSGGEDGIVISDPGCYLIEGSQSDGDEEDSDTSTFVDVQASDVVIDGGGNIIDGTGSGEAVRVDGPRSNVTVRNVTLMDWATGIYVRDADAVTVEDVTVRSGGTGVTIDTTTNATVERVTASNNTDYGVHLQASPGGILANLTADGNTKSNVYLDSSDGATVRDATFTGGGAHGLFVKNSPNASVLNVTARSTNTDGISVDSSGNTTIRNSAARSAGRHGLFVKNSPNASAVGVTVEDVPFDGVHVDSSDAAVVRDSTARRAGQHGVHVTDSKANASIRNNTATNNTDHGFRIHHSDGSVVAENTARNNGAAGIRVSSELATVRENLFERNAVGIHLYTHSHVVENNTIRANGYGITLDGDNTTVAHNRVVGSATAGFRYVSGKDALIYDNLFNNSKNAEYGTDPDPSNRWNVSARAGTNVLGGSVVGGNAWFDPSGDGHSELWDDADADGFADTNYTVNGSSADEHPLNAETDALTVTPASQDYGSVNLTASPTREFVVESRARPAVTVDRLPIEGPDAAAFALESDPAPVTLSTGETVSVNVTFAPSATGLLSANLSVESDTIGVEGANVTLAGEGVDDTGPTADAGPNRTVDSGAAVSFDGWNSTDNVGIVTYEWAFGDGNTSTGAITNHTYTTPGTYTVRLTATDAAGNTGTDALVVTVDPSEPSDGDDANHGGSGGSDTSGDGGGPVVAEPSGEVTVTDLTLLNETVHAGAPLVVRVGLSNPDPVRGRLALTLAANGSVVAERTVAVEMSASRTVSLRTTLQTPGRYSLDVNGAGVGAVEVTARPERAGNASESDTGSPRPPSSPGDGAAAAVEVDATDGSSASISVDDVEPGREVPVEFGDEGPSTGDVSFESLSFIPTEGDPISMNVMASRDPLPGAPRFDRGDNTSRLAHLRVEHSIANEDVDGAAVRFSVSAARLERLGTTPGDVALYRYQNGSWAELPTRVVGERDGGYAFLAESPGLSEFAAGAKQPQFELRTASVEVGEVRVGDEMRVLVRITNTGGADGAYTAKLLLDGAVVEERRLTIASNGTRQIRFDRRMERPGTYRVLVNDFPAGDVVVSGDAAPNTPTGAPPGGGGLPFELGIGVLSALAVLSGVLYRRG